MKEQQLNALKPSVSMIEVKNGKLLTNKDDVFKRRTEYCHDLYSYTADVENRGTDEDDER